MGAAQHGADFAAQQVCRLLLSEFCVHRASGFRRSILVELGCQRCATIPRSWFACMTYVLVTQKRPVRDFLPKGSRSEEDLLREQEEFFQRTTGGEAKPAATLVVRKAVQPAAAPHVSGASKPMSKFALERQRKASAASQADSGERASNGTADTSGHAGGATDAAQTRTGRSDGAQAAPVDWESEKRAPPPKPLGEPMSVVNMTIVEKTTASVAPVAPSVRSTPAPVAQHRSHRSVATGAAAMPWKGNGREGCRGVEAAAPPAAACADDDDEDWVDEDWRDVAGTRGARPRSHSSRGNALGRRGAGGHAPRAGPLAQEHRDVGGGAQGGAAHKTDPGEAGHGDLVKGNATLPSRAEIDRENKQLLGRMSTADIAAMRKEVEAQLDPALLQRMRSRLAKSKQVRLCLLRPTCACSVWPAGVACLRQGHVAPQVWQG